MFIVIVVNMSLYLLYNYDIHCTRTVHCDISIRCSLCRCYCPTATVTCYCCSSSI